VGSAFVFVSNFWSMFWPKIRRNLTKISEKSFKKQNFFEAQCTYTQVEILTTSSNTVES